MRTDFGWKALSGASLVALLFASPVAAANEQVNGYRLPDSPILQTNGYDWWWHNLVAVSRADGTAKPFFFEYYIVNPALAQAQPVYGNNGANKPSYAIVTAGTWGLDAKKINNFYPVSQFSADVNVMNVKIGANNIANETYIAGSVSLSAADAAAHPEYFSDAGSISWSLKAEKFLAFDPGYAVSDIPRDLAILQMFWFVKGMRTKYTGTITYNGQIYDVLPESSYGYADKNWGTDYTNPWLWLSSNKLVSRKTGKELPNSSLDCGGGRPIAAGIDLGEKVLVAFWYEGTFYEYNFAKLNAGVTFNVTETATDIRWSITAINVNSKVVIDFSAPKATMIKIRYESPDTGTIKHKNLWNTGFAQGTIQLYKGDLWGLFGWTLVDTIDGSMGGAEWGQY
ncbi:hypothetical protein M427DRAFT_144352 [Gonapodya prolifera JEL478]|uniref:AttH domain-containing protein n=1 Tax=Gonapodya prolifera (strain JEL478) TaxID=1344416 RepID=A0A139AKP2_GONPJ|nr:hypothetical protein M427DRAFT_144352 [Gonapodya prolifera JEL478]|eukprot:KXS17362.1 hypothetical protein M427DRAFT_144352 [Gonapodya prolifera JEL478]